MQRRETLFVIRENRLNGGKKIHLQSKPEDARQLAQEAGVSGLVTVAKHEYFVEETRFRSNTRSLQTQIDEFTVGDNS